MFNIQTSIMMKIIYAYFIGIAIIFIVAFLNYVNLREINKKIELSFIISDLIDTTFEMRRFEKNYFLYAQQEDYRDNLKYTDKIANIIDKNRESIKTFEGEKMSTLESNINDYRNLIQKHFNLHESPYPDDVHPVEDKIRQKGKEIVTAAKNISIAERQYIQALIASSQKTLIGSGIFLIILGFFIAQYLSFMVIRPLKRFEKSMKRIADGEFSFVPVLSHDKELVSLRRAMNIMLVELELRQKHIIRSEKLASTGTMLFGVAHELNNPLSNISTSCEILKEEPDNGNPVFRQDLLSQIESETDRAKDIVRTILEFSREGKKGMINLRETVIESYRLLRGELPSKIEVHIEIPDYITLFADKQKLEQVFLNLIKNSTEAIPEEGVISINARTNDNNMVEIKVSDTGIGMDYETVSKIFDPFFSNKDTKMGYGLGLFVVHNIIEEHGGSIDIGSEPGHGTTFLLVLPLKENTQ